MNNYFFVIAPNKKKYRLAIDILKKYNVSIFLTHLAEKTLFCEEPSEACVSALVAEGIKVESAAESASQEPETELWPPDVTLEEGVHFDVRDEPETFDVFDVRIPYAKLLDAEVSHPILGSATCRFQHIEGRLYLVDDLSFSYEGVPNPLSLKTLKVKFLTEPFKDKVKYVLLNQFMGGAFLGENSDLTFDSANGGIEIYFN